MLIFNVSKFSKQNAIGNVKKAVWRLLVLEDPQKIPTPRPFKRTFSPNSEVGTLDLAISITLSFIIFIIANLV